MGDALEKRYIALQGVDAYDRKPIAAVHSYQINGPEGSAGNIGVYRFQAFFEHIGFVVQQRYQQLSIYSRRRVQRNGRFRPNCSLRRLAGESILLLRLFRRPVGGLG